MAKKKLPSYWTTVTPFSKIVAFLLFIFLPIITFFLGVNYGRILEKVESETQNTYLVQPTAVPTSTQHMMGY